MSHNNPEQDSTILKLAVQALIAGKTVLAKQNEALVLTEESGRCSSSCEKELLKALKVSLFCLCFSIVAWMTWDKDVSKDEKHHKKISLVGRWVELSFSEKPLHSYKWKKNLKTLSGGVKPIIVSVKS